MVIPVPIPNTEVKHLRGENTLYGKDSSLPVLFIFLTLSIIFLNGFSSTEKTLIVKVIQHLSEGF
jgi:hypothetical protein